MNGTKTIQAENTAKSTKMLQAMVGIGIFCALMIVLTYQGTKPIIKENKAEALERAIFEVVPGTDQTKGFLFEEGRGFIPLEGEEADGQAVYAGFDSNGQLTGVAVEASGQGYADIIRILYGYDPASQKIIGFYVLESKETPGLGDKIEKDADFLANFQGLDVALNGDQNGLQHPVTLVKNGTKENPWEIDAITGATISSRAIGNIIGASSEVWVPRIYDHQENFVIEPASGEQ